MQIFLIQSILTADTHFKRQLIETPEMDRTISSRAYSIYFESSNSAMSSLANCLIMHEPTSTMSYWLFTQK